MSSRKYPYKLIPIIPAGASVMLHTEKNIGGRRRGKNKGGIRIHPLEKSETVFLQKAYSVGDRHPMVQLQMFGSEPLTPGSYFTLWSAVLMEGFKWGMRPACFSLFSASIHSALGLGPGMSGGGYLFARP
jgi:hypothetical protein